MPVHNLRCSHRLTMTTYLLTSQVLSEEVLSPLVRHYGTSALNRSYQLVSSLSERKTAMSSQKRPGFWIPDVLAAGTVCVASASPRPGRSARENDPRFADTVSCVETRGRGAVPTSHTHWLVTLTELVARGLEATGRRRLIQTRQRPPEAASRTRRRRST